MLPGSSPRVNGPKGAVHVPEGFGTAIPTNPTELLKFLQTQKAQRAAHNASRQDVKSFATSSHHSFGQDHQHSNANGLAADRMKKQDVERENFEIRQMALEDYIYKEEGKLRMRLAEERLKM